MRIERIDDGAEYGPEVAPEQRIVLEDDRPGKTLRDHAAIDGLVAERASDFTAR